MEDGEDSTPFWLQSATNTRPTDRLRRRASSLFFSSGLVVFLLLITAVFFLAFVVPSTLSLSAQIFRPNSVKKSWDSLNIVLVLVAVVFGFLSKIKNEDRYSYYDEFQTSPNKQNEANKSSPKASTSSSDQWYNNFERQQKTNTVSNSGQWYGSSYHHPRNELERKDSILRRNSSSYPDLREFSSSRWDYQHRFYDDFHVDASRVTDPSPRHRRHRSVEEFETLKAAPPPPQTKTILVDTLSYPKEENESFSSQMPPLLPANKRAYERIDRRKERVSSRKSNRDSHLPDYEEKQYRRAYENVGKKRERSSTRKLNKDTNPIEETPANPPPPPSQSARKIDTSSKDFFNSIYHKKKPSQKSVDNLNSLLHQPQNPQTYQIPPPPPPPPPPKTFQNIFSSKKHKRKRSTITVPVTIPNPNPQLPTLNPPKIKSFDENSNSGGESPLNRMPPPPPPPPPGFFKTPAWKFVVQGDYVRVDSLTSCRSGSPDLDDVDSDVTPTASSSSPLFFQPSPDVNTKADSFITTFRAKLKMEKNHSLTKREVGLSTLGPNHI